MDEQQLDNRRARRAIPLIAAALTAAVVIGLLYMRSAVSSPTAPPPSSVPVMSGPYNATYDFINPLVGWAMVVDYAVLGTCRSPDLRACPTGSTFWIFKTADGARHWQRQYTGTGQGAIGTLHFFDPEHGIAEFGPNTYRTVDGGGSWRLIQNPQGAGYPAPMVTFASPDLGWALIQDFAGGTSTGRQRLFSTADGGETWRLIPGELPSGADLGPFGAADHGVFTDSGEGWLGGGFISAPIVYHTTDGGASWHAIQVTPERGREYFTSVALIPGGNVLVVASGGSDLFNVYLSSDQGATWQTLPQIPTGNLEDVEFVDANDWWATKDGVIFQTADGGSSWRHVTPQGFPELWNFQTDGVIDAEHAWWAMTSAERSTDNGLAMTSDGGAQWRMVNPPQPG